MEEKIKRLVTTLHLTQDEYEFLKEQANKETRSLSSQILHLLRNGMSGVGYLRSKEVVEEAVFNIKSMSYF